MDEMDRRSRPQGSRPRPRPTRDLDEYAYERRPRRRRPPPDERLPRRRPRRRVWPLLLAGCGLGVFLTVLAAAIIVFLAIRTSQGNSFGSLPVLGGTKPYTKEDITQVQLSTIAQIQVCDKIGNVSIQVDPTASTTTVKTTKIVHMNSQTAANQEFQRIGVEVQPPGTIADSLTCTHAQPTTVPTSTPPSTQTGTPSPANGSTSSTLTVNINLPTSNGLLQDNSDTVNIAIILPPNVLPPDGPTMQLDVEAPVGNISIDGISGMMNVIGDKGNIQVKNGVLTGGSQVVTDLGNITFSGTLGSPINATAQNNFYHISSGQGNIDVTLPATTNITLDTYTNQGKISSEFTIPLQDSNGGMSYQGPLNTASSPPPDITLVIHMNLGNITIHKQQ